MAAKTACHHPHRFCTSTFKVKNNEGYLPRYTEASLPGEAEKHMGAPLQSELLTRKRPFVGDLCVILRQRAVYHESHLSIWTPRSDGLLWSQRLPKQKRDGINWFSRKGWELGKNSDTRKEDPEGQNWI